MKKVSSAVLFLFVFLNLNAQTIKTFVPDDNFEQHLIDVGIDTDSILNDSVLTSNIIGVTQLYLINLNIVDLTGIEDFDDLLELDCSGNQLSQLDVSNNVHLTALDCSDNQLTVLDLSQNSNLTILRCYNNQLLTLDVKNGNNINFIHIFSAFATQNNPNLYCINVDNSSWSTSNWTSIDTQHYFSNNCSASAGINEPILDPKKDNKIYDLLGRKIKVAPIGQMYIQNGKKYIKFEE